MIWRTTFVLCLLLVVSTTLWGEDFTLQSYTWNVPYGSVTPGPVEVSSNIGIGDYGVYHPGSSFVWLSPTPSATPIVGLANLFGTDEVTLEGMIGGGLTEQGTAVNYMSLGDGSTPGSYNFSFGFAYVSNDFGNNTDTGFIAWSDAAGLHVDPLVCDSDPACLNSVNIGDPNAPLGILNWTTSATYDLTDVYAVAIGVTSTNTDPNDPYRAVSQLFVAADAERSIDPAPEPATFLTLGAGLIAAGLLGRRARS
jgi:hypothetical protein